MNKTLLILIGITACVRPLSAAIIWDENVDGDLSNDQATPTALSVTVGGLSDSVKGMVGGSNPGEFFDVFSFDLFYGFCLDSIILESYDSARANQGSGFNLHSGDASVGSNYLVGNTAGEAQVGQDILGGEGPFANGTYTLDIRENTPRQRYQLGLVYCSGAFWNEAFNGDLSNDQTAPTFLDISADFNNVSALIGGAGDSGVDVISFSVPSGLQAEVYLRAYVPVEYNINSGFNFFTGLNGTDGELVETAIFGSANIGQSMNNTPLPSGDYSLVILERTEGQYYGFDFAFTDAPVVSDVIYAFGFE